MSEDFNPEQEELYREVNEEIRQEQLLKIWKKYSLHILSTVILVVLIVAGYEGWKNYEQGVREEESNHYQIASNLMNEKKYDEASQAFEALISKSMTGYKDLSKLQLAAIEYEKGNRKEAVLSLENLIKDQSIELNIRNLSLIKLANLTIDTANPKKLKERLATITYAGSPWRSSALMVVAILEIKDKNIDRAKELLFRLANDKNSLASVRKQSKELLSSLGGYKVKEKTNKKGDN